MVYAKKRAGLKGGVTLEAALVLPLFLYLMVNLLTLFDILRVQTSIDAALHQSGREISLLAFDLTYGEEVLDKAFGSEHEAFTTGTAGAVIAEGYAASRTKAYLAEANVNLQCVAGGAESISFLRSNPLAKDGIIDLVASYQLQPLVRILPFSAFSAESRYYAHAWTGYRIPGTGEDGEENEEIVYITKTGTVYHKDVSCTYLRPSVRSVSRNDLQTLRNASGAIYHACESCGNGSGSGCFVTDYGTRFHTDRSCSKIERNAIAILLSEAGGRAPCSKCGK